jgi:hypothetical protein
MTRAKRSARLSCTPPSRQCEPKLMQIKDQAPLQV